MSPKSALCFLACAGIALTFPAVAQGEQTGTKIAVCNLTQLYQECTVSKDKRAELEAARAKAEKQLQEYRTKIDKVKRELPLYEKESAEYKGRMAKIEELANQAEAKKRVETASLERKFCDFLKEFHGLAAAKIALVAKERGYDMVLQITDLEIGKFSKAERLLNRIFTQQVIYSDKDADISGEVMAELNKDYEAEMGKMD